MTYEDLNSSENFASFMKDLYFASSKQVQELQLPRMKFISYSGRGAPDSADFQRAIPALYGIAYTLKMGFKFGKLPKPEGYFDFKVSPLEGLWWQKDGREFDMNAKQDWQWKVMIMLPDFIDSKTFDEAVMQAELKHPEVSYKNIVFEKFEEGQAIQITHQGPYASETVSVKKLRDYAKEHGYQIAGKHHEIYLNDPRRVKPEEIKTVLRYPVKG